MTTMVRDAWSDARLVATQEVLDDDVAAVRRRAWQRQALVLLLGGVALAAAVLVLGALVASSLDELWQPSLRTTHTGFVLQGLGFVLMMVGSITSTRAGAGRFLRPESVLDRPNRTWLRHRIAEGAPVPPERQEVAVAVARRMAADAASLPQHLGFLLLAYGLTVSGPLGGIVVLTAVLGSWTVVDAVRTQLRAHRARRWLASNA
jgi:uncharacterized membrane protein YidH (DUF202 family)